MTPDKADALAAAIDKACGVGNLQGLPVFEGKQRDLIELALLRLTQGGWAIVPKAQLTTATQEQLERCRAETLEEAARVADEYRDKSPNPSLQIGAAWIAQDIRSLAKPNIEGGQGG